MSPRKKIHDKPGRPLKPIVEPRPSIRLAIEQSERLQIALKLRHMHLPHLSSLTGIRKETLKRIKFPLSRQVGALTTTLYEIALALRVNPGWLAYGDEFCEMLVVEFSPKIKS